jgi:hypothetical protein
MASKVAGELHRPSQLFHFDWVFCLTSPANENGNDPNVGTVVLTFLHIPYADGASRRLPSPTQEADNTLLLSGAPCT